MTTPPVVSVTDELIAELERECREAADIHGGAGSDYDSRLFDRLGDTLAALLAERAELKRDAERYRWLGDEALISTETAPAIMVVDDCGNPVHKGAPWNSLLSLEDADAAIDAAMRS